MVFPFGKRVTSEGDFYSGFALEFGVWGMTTCQRRLRRGYSRVSDIERRETLGRARKASALTLVNLVS